MDTSRLPAWSGEGLTFDSLHTSYSQKMSHVVRKQLPAMGASLLPSPIYNRLCSRKETTRPVGKTAYLDGFRGYAALGVLVLHMTMNIFPNSNFGYNGQEGRNWIFQLPFIRLLYTGQPTLFFIISGYVLSLGTLKKARAQSYGPLQLDIGSKIFRRGLRLYIPSVVSTIIPMLMMYYNLFPEVWRTEEDMPYIFHHLPEPQPALAGQTREWIKMTVPLFSPFEFDNYSQNTPYAYQLWTIPVEFRCSMVLFLVNSALCRCTAPARIIINATLAMICLIFTKWDIFLFLAGGFIAELDMIKQERASQEPPLLDLSEKQVTEQKPIRTWSIVHIAVLVPSLWMLSVPGTDIWNAWSFAILETHAPPTYSVIFQFWDAIGTFGLLWSFTGLPAIQKFFAQPVFLYLGKISFSLYLTHTIMLKAVLYPLLPWLWRWIGYQTTMTYGLSYVIGATVTVLLSLWMADLFQRFVEQPSADFTNWLDRKCCGSLQMGQKP